MNGLQSRRKKAVSLQDVAREACVSLGTASMALNSKKGVSRSTRRLVIDAATKLGYFDHSNRMKLLSRVGVWLAPPELGGSHFETTLLKGITIAASELGIEIINISTSYGRFGAPVPVPNPVLAQVDGVIIHGADLGHLAQLQEYSGEVVLVDSYGPFSHVPFVNNDDEGGAYIAVQHLARLGYDSIGYIGSSSSHGVQTWRGYSRALMQGRICINPRLIDTVLWGVENGYCSMKNMLLQGAMPRAMFCSGDELAYGAIQALQEYGLSVPEDVAVVAMDDINLSMNFNPSLTTVHTSIEELGGTSVRLLSQLMEEKISSVPSIVLPNYLVIRDSCGSNKNLQECESEAVHL